MTDTINNKATQHINFNFYIEINEERPIEKNNWLVSFSKSNKNRHGKRCVFTAKRGPLFRGNNEK